MSTIQIAFLALLFVAVFGAFMLVQRLFAPNPLQDRLDVVAGKKVEVDHDAPRPWVASIVKLTGPLAKLSLPDDGWNASSIRVRFLNAGLRHPYAPVLYFAAKTILAASLPLLVFFFLSTSSAIHSTNGTLFWLLCATGLGYYMPNVLLNHLIVRRQREVFESFPDALDLMTVCVEAGLAMDAALARVAADIGLKSAVLADELHLVTLELRAGSPKDKALRNLALRTGVDDVSALVSMLIQAERFGTSIAASLRVQSDQLRTKRRQRAEEQAAKIALKLLFPLIFFIFPTLLVVLMGPAFIQIYRVMLPALAGDAN